MSEDEALRDGGGVQGGRGGGPVPAQEAQTGAAEGGAGGAGVAS